MAQAILGWLVVGVCALSWPAQAAATAPAGGDPLERAIAVAHAERTRHEYAYTRALKLVAKDKRIDRVERFDPTRPDGERWQLLMTGGREPTEIERDDYEGDGDDGRAFRLYRDLIGNLDPEGAELVELIPERAIYRLKETKAAFLDADTEAFAQYLDSRLVVDCRGPFPYVSELDIVAPEPFRPSVAARIERFEARFRYAPHPRTGEILPSEIFIELAATALFVVSVEATTRIDFRDFVPIAAARD